MKTVFSSVLMAGLFLVGCKQDEAPPAKPTNTSSSGNPITAPVDYLGAISKAQKSANKSLSAVGVDQAVKMFYAQEGRFPKDLNELVPGYLGNVPPVPFGMKYTYDAATGAVKVVPK